MDLLTLIAIVTGCAAVVEDLRRGVISNWTSLTALAGGLIYHIVHQGWIGLAMSSGGALIGFTVFLVFYCMGGLGGGDVKLMAAFGALLGPSGALTAAILAAVSGGILAAGSLLFSRRQRAIRYGPAIVLGAWLALLAKR
ncbi:MAG TPA: prepilin peptidase [Bryobacteraceae bacterium]|nr:prepilin peptidase [Bryobacteraceae bacterium]